jgi:Fe-S oxidoreductase
VKCLYVDYDKDKAVAEIKSLMEEQRVAFSGYSGKATYHDPCYLGRHNMIYSPPREILRSIPGLELVKMRRNQVSAFCCGGGGGNFFTDILGGGENSPNRVRAREAFETGTQVIAVACPNCAKMLTDAVKAEEPEAKTEVLDIAEIVWRARSKQSIYAGA